MSERERTERERIIARALDHPEGRKALAEALTEPIKTALSYGSTVGGKLLLIDKKNSLIDFIKYGLETICYHGALPERLPNNFFEFISISYYLEDNYDEILGLGLNVYYFGKEDFKVHIQYLHEKGSLIEFLGDHYTECKRIYDLSKI